MATVDTDANFWASLAREFLGGLNAPSDGQTGFVPRVDAEKNLTYVRAHQTGTSAQNTNTVRLAIGTGGYTQIAGVFAPIGTPDPGVDFSTTLLGFTVAETTTRVRVRFDLGVDRVDGTNPQYLITAFVAGVEVPEARARATIPASTGSRRMGFTAVLDAARGDFVEVRIMALTAATTQVDVYDAMCTAELLT